MERNELDSLEIEANWMATPPKFNAGWVVVAVEETVADVVSNELRDAEAWHNYWVGGLRIPFIRRR